MTDNSVPSPIVVGSLMSVAAILAWTNDDFAGSLVVVNFSLLEKRSNSLILSDTNVFNSDDVISLPKDES